MRFVSSTIKLIIQTAPALIKQLSFAAVISGLMLMLILLSSPVFSQSQFRITELITDFDGYWKSGVGAINPAKPDNSHNVLSFSHNGVRYSTGVNDLSLSSHGDSFIAGDYRALPVSSITGVANGNTKIGLGEKYDGVTNGKSNPSPANNIPYYLTDGIKGLNIGTCVANLPAGSLSFAISNINLAAISDNVPDIVITQTGDPSGGDFDRYEFTDINGNRVGNYVDIILNNIPSVGNWVADFYEASTNPMNLSAGFTKTERAIRLWTGDIGAFGINASNVSRIAYFKIVLNGNSDVSFVAYNNKAFNVDLILPIKLKSFSGKTLSNGIQLNWQTVSESNSSKFIIEKSPDGTAFTPVGNINAAGTSNNPKHYNFTAPAAVGKSYYRLRMVDLDGKFTNSQVITIDGGTPDSITISVYPNPSVGETYVSHPYAAANETVRIYNSLGMELNHIKASGNKTRIDLTKYGRGSYHVIYYSPAGTSVTTIVKQ